MNRKNRTIPYVPKEERFQLEGGYHNIPTWLLWIISILAIVAVYVGFIFS